MCQLIGQISDVTVEAKRRGRPDQVGIAPIFLYGDKRFLDAIALLVFCG
jgi:hypothetical protein